MEGAACGYWISHRPVVDTGAAGAAVGITLPCAEVLPMQMGLQQGGGIARAAVGVLLPRVAPLPPPRSLPPRSPLFADVAVDQWWGPIIWRRHCRQCCRGCGVVVVVVARASRGS